VQLLFHLWLKHTLHFLVGFFYRYSRRLHVTGHENVPHGVPLLLCSNHPNAFMDAIIVGMTVKRRSWFLVRSDVFRKKWMAAAFEFIGMLPIYRLQEGAENLAKNDETFARCTAMLERKKAIIIFSEGLCIQERRLRKLKKGTARIAFTAEEANNFQLGLQIVPVGINYSSTPWKFRTTVHVRFGKPFAAADYADMYRESPAKAVNQFTRELETRMAEEIVIIENKEDDEMVAGLEEMFLRERTREAGGNPSNQCDTHLTSVKLAQLAGTLSRTQPEKAEALRHKVKDYLARVHDLGIRDWNLRPSSIEKMGSADVLGDAAFFTLGFPVWIFGVITNYIPYKVPYLLTQKIVKHIEWHASINATVGAFLWLLCWGLESLAVALLFRNWWLLAAFMLAMPLSGMFAQYYYVRIRRSNGKSALLAAMRKNKAEVEALINLRHEIDLETAFPRS
jgi:1-acyl-sn-glycerol-3-phosphate acyltransferase